LTDEEKERTLLVFIQAVLNDRDDDNLFVTHDDVLLKHRLWLRMPKVM